jgi:cell division protein FtsB
VTSEQLRKIHDLAHETSQLWHLLARQDEEKALAQEWCSEMIEGVHSLKKPSARRYAGAVLARLLERSLFEWRMTMDIFRRARYNAEIAQRRVAHYEAENQRYADRIAALEAQVADLEAELDQRPQKTTVRIPATTIKIRSSIDQELLRQMLTHGLTRSWRLYEAVIAAGHTENENSVRNALNRLTERGLVEDYCWNGKAQVWSPKPGGGRRLVRLTEKGRAVAAGMYDVEPAPCELDAMIRAHRSVSHAVGILEARDHLRARGYRVEDDPDAFLAASGEQWGERTEPDLLALEDGVRWPVEVQREVAMRQNEKWAKALDLGPGRLVLIVFSEEMQEKQRHFLELAIRRHQITPGEIRLGSLEAMENDAWQWETLRS